MKTYFKSVILTAIVLFLFIISFVIGFMLTLDKAKIKTKEQLRGKNITEIAYINNDFSQRINKDTIFVVRKYFRGCGHIIEQKSNIDKDFVGLNKQEFKKLFSGWEIEAFNSKYVVISRAFDGYCPNHYIISIKDDRIAVFYSQPVDGELLKMITPIEVKNLPQKDVNDLKKGIVVNSFDDAIKIIEDFGS